MDDRQFWRLWVSLALAALTGMAWQYSHETGFWLFLGLAAVIVGVGGIGPSRP